MPVTKTGLGGDGQSGNKCGMNSGHNQPERDETYNWHFVDIPKDARGFSDALGLAKAAWVDDGGSVDEQYYRQQVKVVDERLALARLRLAALLNGVLGHVSPQEFRH
jgi:hypothetical protein